VATDAGRAHARTLAREAIQVVASGDSGEGVLTEDCVAD
jgi:hypothetical protein